MLAGNNEEKKKECCKSDYSDAAPVVPATQTILYGYMRSKKQARKNARRLNIPDAVMEAICLGGGSYIFPTEKEERKRIKKLTLQKQRSIEKWESVLIESGFNQAEYYYHWELFCQTTCFIEKVRKLGADACNGPCLALIIRYLNVNGFRWLRELSAVAGDKTSEKALPGAQMYACWLDLLMPNLLKVPNGCLHTFNWRNISDLAEFGQLNGCRVDEWVGRLDLNEDNSPDSKKVESKEVADDIDFISAIAEDILEEVVCCEVKDLSQLTYAATLHEEQKKMEQEVLDGIVQDILDQEISSSITALCKEDMPIQVMTEARIGAKLLRESRPAISTLRQFGSTSDGVRKKKKVTFEQDADCKKAKVVHEEGPELSTEEWLLMYIPYCQDQLRKRENNPAPFIP